MTSKKNPPSLYWHDYETSGTDPQRDRPTQFAGVRTDLDLNIIGEPLSIYCKPADDFLPQPESCLITGITPQKAAEEGLPEYEFIRRIHGELATPGTCALGYNSIRFDDEVTRHTLYRNFYDPYGREWQNGNSRWDIIDVVRLARALRPEGMEWPFYEDGRPSYRLEDITRVNGVDHESAHDALSDVYATIAVARLIKQAQPKLWDFAFQNRSKQKLAAMLNVRERKPLLHFSGMYPSELGCAAVVVPLAYHPSNKNGIIVYDLRYDPEPLLTLGAEKARQRIFTPKAEMPEGVERIPLKTIHLNRSPIVAPLTTLAGDAAKRLQIDLNVVRRNLDTLQHAQGLHKKIQAIFNEKRDAQPTRDAEVSLYGGGFFGDQDKSEMERIRAANENTVAELKPHFEDDRLAELFFRYRARNFPETLNDDEKAEWAELRRRRLTDPEADTSITLDDYFARLQQLREENTYPGKEDIFEALETYGEQLRRSL